MNFQDAEVLGPLVKLTISYIIVSKTRPVTRNIRHSTTARLSNLKPNTEFPYFYRKSFQSISMNCEETCLEADRLD